MASGEHLMSPLTSSSYNCHVCCFQVQALCSSIQDTSVLVQRSALDLLLMGFPMHNSELTRPDMIKMMTATIKVLLRRDMSLNRRLYAWLLGTDANGMPIQVRHAKQHRPMLYLSNSDEYPLNKEAMNIIEILNQPLWLNKIIETNKIYIQLKF